MNHTLRTPARIAAVAALTAVLMTGCGTNTPAPTAAPAPVTVTATKTAAPVTVTATPAPVTKTAAPVTVTQDPVTETETVTETSDPYAADESDAAEVTGLKVGEGITVTNDDGVTSIKVLSAKRVTDGTGEYSKNPKNGVYLLIDIEYTCTSGTCSYNPYDWNLRSKDGHSYDGTGAYQSGYSDQELHSGDLVKGAKARGLVVVDAPKGAMTLEYTSGFGAPATWLIP